MRIDWRRWAALACFLVIVIGVGALIGFTTAPDGWYAKLAKPPFNPPNWIFAPVWTALYALMALGVFRILRLPVGIPGRRRALLVAGERDDGEVVAVADLDHEAVGVVEEDLVHVDAALLHAALHVRDADLLQPPLHRHHALALQLINTH